jgi:hypothetical protein
VDGERGVWTLWTTVAGKRNISYYPPVVLEKRNRQFIFPPDLQRLQALFSNSTLAIELAIDLSTTEG